VLSSPHAAGVATTLPSETEHRNATNLENGKTLCLLAFSGVKSPKYRAGFLNRVSQVRILPRALIPVFLATSCLLVLTGHGVAFSALDPLDPPRAP
jgi:hypothetical protein